MQISQELLEQISNMKVWNAETLDQKVLLLIFSYELLIEWKKVKKKRTSKSKETMQKILYNPK